MTEKTCTKCNETKDETEFVRKYGKYSQPCLACRRVYGRKFYLENKEYYLERNEKYNQQKRAWFSEMKATLECISCGEKHPACLQFHHRNPDEKEIDITHAVARGWSEERLSGEIQKCDVLCANCHLKLHFEEGTGSWSKKKHAV